jgi:hypothetical protein
MLARHLPGLTQANHEEACQDTGYLAEIRIEHFPNRCKKDYRLSQCDRLKQYSSWVGSNILEETTDCLQLRLGEKEK